MKLAIGMVELNSIAKGIETCDYMVKSARVELLRSATTCPGKYLILIGGETGDVKTAVAEGISRGGGNVVDSLLLPNVHPAVIPAVRSSTFLTNYTTRRNFASEKEYLTISIRTSSEPSKRRSLT